MFFGQALRERVVQELGEAPAAMAYEIAAALRRLPHERQAERPETAEMRLSLETQPIPVTRSDIRAAAGTANDAFNRRLVEDTVAACARPGVDVADTAAEVLGALKDIAPANAREGMIAAQLIVTHAAAMDSLKLARSTGGVLRDYHLMHAARLGHAHAALSEALDRMRRTDRRVIVLEYRRFDREKRRPE
jgi:hypothetical protein